MTQKLFTMRLSCATCGNVWTDEWTAKELREETDLGPKAVCATDFFHPVDFEVLKGLTSSVEHQGWKVAVIQNGTIVEVACVMVGHETNTGSSEAQRFATVEVASAAFERACKVLAQGDPTDLDGLAEAAAEALLLTAVA